MKTFVVADVHGHISSLENLCDKAGVIAWGTDGQPYREAEHDGEEFRLVHIGDLMNCVRNSIAGDETCLEFADRLFDVLLVGNHEAPYVYDGMSFGGFYYSNPLRDDYRDMWKAGFVVPCLTVGNTLLTHAGVHKSYDFDTAEEAFDSIRAAAQDYDEMKFKIRHQAHQMSPAERSDAAETISLISGVGPARGGWERYGGILWSDYDEPKNEKFNQVFGHTPMQDGPHTQTSEKHGTFCMNIDCAAKIEGNAGTGVWLDESGQVIEVVKGEDYGEILEANGAR